MKCSIAPLTLDSVESWRIAALQVGMMPEGKETVRFRPSSVWRSPKDFLMKMASLEPHPAFLNTVKGGQRTRICTRGTCSIIAVRAW